LGGGLNRIKKTQTTEKKRKNQPPTERPADNKTTQPIIQGIKTKGNHYRSNKRKNKKSSKGKKNKLLKNGSWRGIPFRTPGTTPKIDEKNTWESHVETSAKWGTYTESERRRQTNSMYGPRKY